MRHRNLVHLCALTLVAAAAAIACYGSSGGANSSANPLSECCGQCLTTVCSLPSASTLSSTCSSFTQCYESTCAPMAASAVQSCVETCYQKNPCGLTAVQQTCLQNSISVTASTGNAGCGQVCPGTPGAACPSCSSGLTNCSTSCVDLQTDANNCGTCGNVCPTATPTCSGGACAGGTTPTCNAPAPLLCSGSCIDPTSNATYCGASGSCTGTSAGTNCVTSLGAGATCVNSKCTSAPPPPTCASPTPLLCGGTCVDPTTNTTWCGASGSCTGTSAGTNCVTAKGAGATCVSSVCTPAATTCSGSAPLLCGGTCVDPTSNTTYCGASDSCTGTSAGTNCVTSLGAGATCVSSVCTPAATTCSLPSITTCNVASTTNPCTDNVYCGATGNCMGYTPDAGNYAGVNCAGDYLTCVNGVCGCPQPNQITCGFGNCIDPSTNPTHCGATGDCTGTTAGATNYAGVDCTGGTCTGGTCTCTAGDILCGGACVNPMTSAMYCGASGNCQGATPGANYAGVNCGLDGTCTGGVCTCSGVQIVCAGLCTDPTSNPAYCGASGNCQGANAGTNCNPDGGTGSTCLNGACAGACPSMTNQSTSLEECWTNSYAPTTPMGGTITPGTYTVTADMAYEGPTTSITPGCANEPNDGETIAITSTTISDISATDVTGWTYVTSGSTLTATQTCGVASTESTWGLVNGYTVLDTNPASFQVFQGNSSYEVVITFTMKP
jgi:hypothetical protein